MAILEVESLHKQYPKFHLNDVSFSLDQGYIMGFIGVNGAGKTTTLKCMLNMVRPDSGEVRIFGKDVFSNELEIKRKLGVVLGDKDVYKQYRIGRISRVISRFYEAWDQKAYEDYCRRFDLDQDRKLDELSEGMKTKYFLTLALCHGAELFILDEPTSGLDPAARDDLLEVFQELVEDGQKSILYSTHITSDLEKCADFITYIHDGRIIDSTTKDDLMDSYRMVHGPADVLTSERAASLVSHRDHQFGFSGLVRTRDSDGFDRCEIAAPTLEEIMIYHARRRNPVEEPAV